MESFTIGSMMIAELCKYVKNYWDDFLEWMNTWMNVWYANNISTNLFLRIITELSTLYGFISFRILTPYPTFCVIELYQLKYSAYVYSSFCVLVLKVPLISKVT